MDILRSLKQVAKVAIPESVLFNRRVRRALAGEWELNAVLKLSGGRTFLDVGANEGAWAAAAAPAFRQVHAFEPIASLAAKIGRLVPRNVTVHHAALSDHAGTATLFIPMIDGLTTTSRASLEADANGVARTHAQDVELLTLDSYRFTGVDVIKIDVEGHEFAALKGAEQTLARERPALIVEIEERHHEGQSEAIIAWVCERNYDCYFFGGAGVERFQAGDITRLQPHRQSKVGTRFDNYVNNFVFLPRERPELLLNIQ